jgi:RAP1 GTPase activating protein 1
MLPYKEEDKQHLERKRHIGNDIVIIVFQDVDPAKKDACPSFEISTLVSHQNHVVCAVRPTDGGYR